MLGPDMHRATQQPLPFATSSRGQAGAIARRRRGIARATTRPVTCDATDGDDFEDLTVPEQPVFVALDVAFDPTSVAACERARRSARRRARVRRVIALLGSGVETVAARPLARRRPRPSRLAGLAAGVSLVATSIVALVMSGA